MAEKIKKTYTVGGKTFDTYDEAIAHRKNAGGEKTRQAVADIFEHGFNWENVRRGQGYAVSMRNMLDALFAAFDIKPKKPGK